MNELQKIFNNIVASANATGKIKNLFSKKIETGLFSKDEDKFSHFCVYFPAYEPEKRLVFMGHHKKSGLWLVNGGHIETGETPRAALKREIGEEWGIGLPVDDLLPKLLTITNIESNPAKRACKTHFDIWYFIPQNFKEFAPDQNLLTVEFYETGWKTFDEARALTKDPNTLAGIGEIEKQIQNI